MANESYGNLTETTSKVADEVQFIILALLIIAVNLCVIVVVWKNNGLHKWQNYLLVSLAFSDLSTGLFGLPIALACTLGISTRRKCIICLVSYTFFKFISISTILHLLTITYERFMSIVYPLRHRRAKHVYFKIALVAIWSISVTVAVVPFSWMGSEACVGDDDTGKHWLVYNVITLILFLLIPIILFINAFVSMFLAARIHIRKQGRLRAGQVSGPEENPKALRKEARVAIIFALMWIIFVICWSPYFALNVMSELQKVMEDLPETFEEAANVLRFLTSLLNPILYSLGKKDFCQALSKPCLTRRKARERCLPHDRRCTARQEIPKQSNAALRLSEIESRGFTTQVTPNVTTVCAQYETLDSDITILQDRVKIHHQTSKYMFSHNK